MVYINDVAKNINVFVLLIGLAFNVKQVSHE